MRISDWSSDVCSSDLYLPHGESVLRAFQRPLTDVKVLIIGQDPYPTPGHPIGLSFAVAPDVRPIPRSLANIYAELETDLGLPRAPHGAVPPPAAARSEEHTSELQSLMRISYAVFCLKKKKQ